jgi:beta-glucosidase
LNSKLMGTGGPQKHYAKRQSREDPHPIRLEYFHGSGSAGIDLTWQVPAEALRAEAVRAAKHSDVTVAFVGLSPSLEGEELPVKLDGFSGGDRTALICLRHRRIC